MIKAPTTQKETRNVVFRLRLTLSESNAIKQRLTPEIKHQSKLFREALKIYLLNN